MCSRVEHALQLVAGFGSLAASFSERSVRRTTWWRRIILQQIQHTMHIQFIIAASSIHIMIILLSGAADLAGYGAVKLDF
jgi:hypothetical protein